MELSIENQKIELIQWLTTLKDKTVIMTLIDFKNNQTKDWWEEISSAEKESIKKGIIDAELNKLKPQSEARKIYEKWL